MAVQAEISRQKLAEKVGSMQSVLLDEVQGSQAVGRTKADAPEIDGIVSVKGAKGAKVGDIVRVRITGATDHDLAGSIVR
jgi:ribosomal protein S12 methylthiotransferase